MKIVGKQAIDKFAQKYVQARKPLERWAGLVEAASWDTLIEVRKTFPSADGLKLKGKKIVIFNIKGNDYRLITSILYEIKRVIIRKCMTHEEYSKGLWKAHL